MAFDMPAADSTQEAEAQQRAYNLAELILHSHVVRWVVAPRLLSLLPGVSNVRHEGAPLQEENDLKDEAMQATTARFLFVRKQVFDRIGDVVDWSHDPPEQERASRVRSLQILIEAYNWVRRGSELGIDSHAGTGGGPYEAVLLQIALRYQSLLEGLVNTEPASEPEDRAAPAEDGTTPLRKLKEEQLDSESFAALAERFLADDRLSKPQRLMAGEALVRKFTRPLGVNKQRLRRGIKFEEIRRRWDAEDRYVVGISVISTVWE